MRQHGRRIGFRVERCSTMCTFVGRFNGRIASDRRLRETMRFSSGSRSVTRGAKRLPLFETRARKKRERLLCQENNGCAPRRRQVLLDYDRQRLPARLPKAIFASVQCEKSTTSPLIENGQLIPYLFLDCVPLRTEFKRGRRADAPSGYQ